MRGEMHGKMKGNNCKRWSRGKKSKGRRGRIQVEENIMLWRVLFHLNDLKSIQIQKNKERKEQEF